MGYKIATKNTKLKTDSLKIAGRVTHLLLTDQLTKRKHGFNIQGPERHELFRAKAEFSDKLCKYTNLDVHEYFEGLNNDLFNQISSWRKEEILFIVDHLNYSLKYLTNHSALQRHSMFSIKTKRSLIKRKDIINLPRKIVCWLEEIGYIQPNDSKK